MSTSTVTSKGRSPCRSRSANTCTSPPGDRIDFVIEENGRVVVRKVRSRLKQLRGMLREPNRKPEPDGSMMHDCSTKEALFPRAFVCGLVARCRVG